MNSEILHLLLVSLCFICYLVSGENGRDSMATLSLGPCCVLLGKLLPDDDRMASAALVDNALDLVHIVSLRRSMKTSQVDKANSVISQVRSARRVMMNTAES